MSQILINANGYGFLEKCELFEKQVRSHLDKKTAEQLDILDFQRYVYHILAGCGMLISFAELVYLLPTPVIRIATRCTFAC